LNTPFSIAARGTEVLPASRTWRAFDDSTRLAYDGNDDVSNAHSAHAVASVHDFRQALMAKDEVLGIRRARPELKCTDVAIGPADADVENAKPQLVVGSD
jgi:hypothetical protein